MKTAMNPNLKGPLAFLRQNVLFLLCILAFLARAIQNLTLFSIPNRIEYMRYATVVQDVMLALGLVGLYIVLWQRTDSRGSRSGAIWTWSVCFGIGLIIIMEVYVNPIGIYPWNISPVYLAGGARAIKLKSYDRLRFKPEIVVMGSSRALQLESDYIQERFGKRTFNWSVEGGGPIDTLTSTNLLIETQSPIFVVLVVEISHILVSPAWKERTPIALIPYLPNLDMALQAIQTQLEYLFTFQAFAESTFTYLYVYGKFPESFYPDGTAIFDIPEDKSIYRKVIQDTGAAIGGQLRCIQLYPDGREALETLVRLADRHKFGIVFYNSPINADFLDTLDLKDPAYQECSNLIGRYIAEISQNHANVFYRNLTMYEPLSNLREKGFGDIEHLNKYWARRLIDTIAPEIEKAIQWSASQRNQR